VRSVDGSKDCTYLSVQRIHSETLPMRRIALSLRDQQRNVPVSADRELEDAKEKLLLSDQFVGESGRLICS
jgi:hypothetical protein